MAGAGSVARSQSKLVREGLEEQFPDDDGNDESASKRYGYPVQAHHCICCSVIQKNSKTKMAKLAIDSNYDVNNGKNCIFLPAKFGHMRHGNLQRHRGGHWQTYYDYVDAKLTKIYQKHKDKKPCSDKKAAKAILGDLMSLQSTLYSKLKNRKLWLYDWSERLYNEDYREEGQGDLKSINQQPSSAAGLAWADEYPKGSKRRKLQSNGRNLRKQWYSAKGFPVPGGPKS